MEKKNCPTKSFQKIEISLPVTTKPFAKVGEIETKCCGDPELGTATALLNQSLGEELVFVIKQKICVEIPVTFGCETETKEMKVTGNEISTHDICKDCDKEEEEECPEDDEDENETSETIDYDED